ncbi:MAG: glycosyltransferase [Oscillospiraceae bacterium]|jgi:glycosyltransferase involved in cell wall biosynthesis|nr:glycosyltransferase [Oscillospiraceae bacterium]
MTIVLTQAYNAEKTLPRTIDSVLSQTGVDIEYHILDSASTDGTWGVILEAAQCPRIVPVKLRENRLTSYIDYIRELCRDETVKDNDTLVNIDADDLFLPDALRVLDSAIRDEKADIAIGSVRFTDHENWIKDCVIDRADLPHNFYYLYRFMATFWAKFYTFGLLRKADLCAAHRLRCLNDSLAGPAIWKNARRIACRRHGILQYVEHPGQVTRVFDPQRLEAPPIVYRAWMDFLESFGQPVSFENRMLLYRCYHFWVREQLLKMRGSPIPYAERQFYIDFAANHPLVREAERSGTVARESIQELADIRTMLLTEAKAMNI